MKIVELVEYPVKSFQGISAQSSTVNSRGLGLDRRYMLVNTYNEFLTQRSLPVLTQYHVAIADKLTISNGGADISVPVAPVGSELKVKVWDDECSAIEVNRELSAWLSERLNQDVKLVYMQESDIRNTDPDYSLPGDKVSFADGYPILITSMTSLAELNSRLQTPIPMNRFRANIIVDGEAPFAEDKWNRIKIGEVLLRAAKPCARCQVITTNQNTGLRNKEPLTALSEFRKVNNKVLFGLNLVPESVGPIAVGDPVELI